MELIIDPEFNALIRRLSHEEYRGLEESILEEGCRDPLVVWGNTLVDGHHRYEICIVHDIPFNTVQREFASRSDAKIWIAKNQFAKRNLSNWDRCMLALSLEDAFKAKAKERQLSGLKQFQNDTVLTNLSKREEPINTRAEVAKIAGISEGTIGYAKVIQKKASPEQIARLENREASISAIYNQIKEKETPEKAQAEEEEAEPQKELPVSTETPAPDTADKQDATEQPQQQSEPYKEPTNVQAATEPVEPHEPSEPTEPVEPPEPVEPHEPTEPVEPSKPVEPHEPSEPSKEPDEEPQQSEQETAKVEITSESAVSSQDETDLKPGLESNEIASQQQEEAQEQAETPDEGGEDTKLSKEIYEKMFGGAKTAEGKESQLARKTSTSDVKPERTKSEPEKPSLKIPDDYTPETIFQCLSCYERFGIQQNTACPFCHSKNIIESAFDKLPCDYTPRKKADKQDTDDDDEELKYWQELIDKNSIDTPADYKTANELIKYFQEIELETSGGYRLEYEKRFVYNGGKYRVVAFGVNNDERGRDGILGIIFVKE